MSSSFIKDIFRVGLSNGVIIISGLITSIITARYIGPEGNGIIAALIVFPSLFMSLGSLGVRQSTTYFLGKGVFTEELIKKAITQIWFLSTIISLVSCYLLITNFSEVTNEVVLVLLAILPIPFTLFNVYNSGIFLGKNDLKSFNKINWIPSLVTLIATILFVIILNYDVKGALMAICIGPIVMMSLLIIKSNMFQYFTFNLDYEIIKSLLKLGLIYAFSLFVINLNYRIDIILLSKLSSSYELGLYYKGSNITQYLWQIPMLLSTIVFARSAVSKNDLAFSQKVSQLLRVSLILIGVASMVLFVFSEPIILLMYGDEFQGSISVLNILLPGVIILTFFKVMNMDLAGKGKPWISLKALIPSLIFNIILNITLIPKYGANGAAISSTLSYAFAGILFVIFYSKEVGIPVKEIFRFKKSDFEPILNLLTKKSK